MKAQHTKIPISGSDFISILPRNFKTRYRVSSYRAYGALNRTCHSRPNLKTEKPSACSLSVACSTRSDCKRGALAPAERDEKYGKHFQGIQTADASWFCTVNQKQIPLAGKDTEVNWQKCSKTFIKFCWLENDSARLCSTMQAPLQDFASVLCRADIFPHPCWIL